MKSFASKHIFASLLIFLLSFETYAQNRYYEANLHFENKEYDLAIPYYIKIITVEPSAENFEKLAQSYYYTFDYLNAEIYFKKAIELTNTNPMIAYLYAETLQKNERFEAAIEQYEKLLTQLPQLNKKLTLHISSCKQALLWKTPNTNKVEILNLKNLNSEFEESGIHLGKNKVYFSSSRNLSKIVDEKNSSKIAINNFRVYSANFANINDVKGIKSPIELVFPNTKQHDDLGHPSLNSAEDVCYFSSAYSYTFGRTKFDNHEEETYTEIYIAESKKIKNKWSMPISILSEDMLNYKMLHPCLSANGKRMYFASNMLGGYGSYDIYYIDKDEKNNWGKPVNLGALINTSENELYPSFANDTVLYFSSNGRIGMGDLDIYKANLVNGEIVSIENLKYPLNSTYNDHSFVPNSTFHAGLFCSNRPGGSGLSDIYWVKLKK
jgi:peptidoglycan-associated lipoprotein